MNKLTFLFYLIVGLASAQSLSEKPTTLILIRHAERGHDGSNDPPLTEAGTTRANSLVTILKNSTISAIYTSNYKRTRNTATPLAHATGLDIKTYEPMQGDELKKIISENKGKTVLIVGHSNTIPWTANFLTGSKLENFADSDYGNLMIVNIWDDGKASLNWLVY